MKAVSGGAQDKGDDRYGDDEKSHARQKSLGRRHARAYSLFHEGGMISAADLIGCAP